MPTTTSQSAATSRRTAAPSSRAEAYGPTSWWVTSLVPMTMTAMSGLYVEPAIDLLAQVLGLGADDRHGCGLSTGVSSTCARPMPMSAGGVASAESMP